MKYGYCRISTKQQSIERQIRNIQSAFPDAHIIQEAFTGTKIEGRKQFERLMKTVKAGDTIIFDSVSRMSRNAAEGFTTYKELFGKGVNLVFIKEPQISTETYKQAAEVQIPILKCGDDIMDEYLAGQTELINRLLLRLAERQIQLAFDQAQKEVDDLHQRTREGMETARLEGKQIGGVKGKTLTTKKSIESKQIILQHAKEFGGSLSDTEVMKLTGLARNTYYKYKRELKNERA